MHVVTTKIHCQQCQNIWDAETLANVPIKVYIALIRTLHCPNCGANYKKIGIVLDEEKLRATLAEKALKPLTPPA